MAEVEELRLVITLTDNASEGVAALRQQFAHLGSGATQGHVEKFKKGHNELGKQIKEMAELAEGGEKAMLGFIGKFGLAGTAVAALGAVAIAGLHSLKEYADKIVEINNKAKVIGIHPAVLKSIHEQLERIGVSAEIADENVARFNEAYADMGRVGSQRHQELITKAGRFGAAMEEGIQKVLHQRGEVAQINEALAQAQNVYNQRLKETNGNVQDATEFVKSYLRYWGLDPTFALVEHLHEVGEEERKMWDARVKATSEYHKVVSDLSKEFTDWMDEVKDSALTPDGLIVTGLKQAMEVTKFLHEMWNKPLTKEVAKGTLDTMGYMIPGVNTVLFWKNFGALYNWWTKEGQSKSLADQLGADMLPEGKGTEAKAQHLLSQDEDRGDTIDDNTGQLKKLNDYLALLELGNGGGGGGGGIASRGSVPATSGGSAPTAGSTPSSPPSTSGASGPIGGTNGLDSFTNNAAGGGGAAPGVAGGPSATFPGTFPSTAELQDKSRPAGERFNNPFNMWYDKYAGQQGGKPGFQITQHDTPAIFPSKQAGASAAIRKMAMSPMYSGKTMQDMIATWVGHGQSYAPIIEKMTGISRNTRITPEFLASADGIKFLKAMSRYETKSSEPYHLTDEQWVEARDAALGKTAAATNVASDRQTVDRKSIKTVKVDATGKVAVNIGASGGSDATLGSTGLFKPTDVERSAQMVKAETGPSEFSSGMPLP